MPRPTLEVADIFRTHGAAYREAHRLPLEQLRVMRAIEVCRTAALGGHLEKCDYCAEERNAYNSCRNRHCPTCQGAERVKWLESRKAELLPVEYFHVVFTVPEQIAQIAFYNKETVYNILFHATAETLLTIAGDPKHLGAGIGFFAILHTWGQNLLHHPHLHCVVPGGGLSPDHERWIACLPGFFPPVRVLASLFRRLFLEELEDAFYQRQLQFPVPSSRSRTPSPLRHCCARRKTANGLFTRNLHSAARNRRSSTSAVIPTVSPYPINDSSQTKTARFLSSGRTINTKT